MPRGGEVPFLYPFSSLEFADAGNWELRGWE